jgi:N-acetylmuramoyl-L-alanine amidase
MLHARTVALAALTMALMTAASAPGTVPPAWGEPAIAAPATKPASATCDHKTFHVVVDVGHTARNPGAKSARGADEYDFNLRLAKEIDEKLIAAGFERTTLLITTETPRSALFKRASRAGAMRADLFLSIHHDSVPDKFLQKWEFEGAAHGYSDRFPGHSIFISNQNPERARSLQFAKMLGDELKARGLKYTPHYTEKFMGHRQRILVDAEAGVYRYDQLIVLRTTKMPAVLLEAGSIINRDEELVLNTPERRGLTSDAAVAAVENFCALPGRHNPPTIAHARHAPGHAAVTTTSSIAKRP